MNKSLKILISLLVIVLIAGGIYLFQNKDLMNGDVSTNKLALACEEHQGIWLEDYMECEYPDSKEWCLEAGGQFLECESACRNDPEAEICTMQCVIVCKF